MLTNLTKQSTHSAQQLIKTISDRNESYNIVLDIGCGYGYSTKQLASNVKHNKIIALDSDPNVISFAKHYNKTDSIEYLTEDMSLSWLQLSSQLKRFESKVSLIVSNNAFHCFANKSQLLTNLSKFLRKNCLIHAMFSTLPDINRKLSEEQIQQNSQYIRSMSAEEQLSVWFRCLAESGLTVKEFRVSDSVCTLNRRQIIENFPALKNAYKMLVIDENEWESVMNRFEDLLFDTLIDPNSEEPNPNAWKEFIANESIRELSLHFKAIHMICEKPFDK